MIKTDILLFQYGFDITAAAQTFDFGVPAPTAVELIAFDATAGNGEVLLAWETASELSNLGFHLYRASSPSGPFEAITRTPIPGLGSSPVGASYTYRDSASQTAPRTSTFSRTSRRRAAPSGTDP